MEGAVWKKWETKYDEVPEGKEQGIIKTAVQAVSEHLDTLAATGVWRVSSRVLRGAVPECQKLRPDTFTAVIIKTLDLNQRWIRDGKSLLFVKEAFKSYPYKVPIEEIL